MPSVAVTGEVVATASTRTTLAGAPGAWTAGPVIETSYSKLTVGGKAVIHQAMCTFIFTPNTGSPVSAPLTLSASTTALQGGLSNVLRDGDSKDDTNGNRLEVMATHPPALNAS